MQVEVGSPWDGLVEKLLGTGRYASADEVVADGLRLIEERESKLAWLRVKIERSLEGGELTEEDVEGALDEVTKKLRATGT